MNEAILVQGLTYGDEAKGATVDFLCRKLPVDLVVRFNGGSQAAHNVVTPEGTHHTFSQFGSGMLANDSVRTHLSRFMLVNPLNMGREARELQVGMHTLYGGTVANGLLGRTTIDPRCVVVTPFHRALNRWREDLRGEARHGSCGQGIGVAREWQLRYGDWTLLAGDLRDYDKTKRKLESQRRWLWEEMGKEDRLHFGDYELGHLVLDYIRWPQNSFEFREDADVLRDSRLAVFEGAQGVLLDETHGETDHNTWTDCTFANADTLLDEAGVAKTQRFRIGCLRTYLTRHGHGPLEDELACSLDAPPEPHNAENAYQGRFRCAPFNYGLVEKALDIVNGVDCLALSHMDVFDTHRGDIEDRLMVTTGIRAYGPTAKDRSMSHRLEKKWGLR